MHLRFGDLRALGPESKRIVVSQFPNLAKTKVRGSEALRPGSEARAFVSLQQARHEADYDLTARSADEKPSTTSIRAARRSRFGIPRISPGSSGWANRDDHAD